MADFDPAFEKMIRNEGGYQLHKVSGDSGGLTFAGIARNYHSSWPGWALIDRQEMDNPQLTTYVREFYQENFWNRVKGEKIKQQAVAETLFDFAVNTGPGRANKLAQIVIGVTPDGIIGPISLKQLNAMDSDDFRTRYALAKVARYAAIVNRDRSQSKFLLGWINRTLKDLKEVA